MTLLGYPDTLGPTALYVTAAAAKQFAEARGNHAPGPVPEETRRYLTALLVEHGKLSQCNPDKPALYRARSRQTQLDVSARVVLEGPLLVVVSVNVREYR